MISLPIFLTQSNIFISQLVLFLFQIILACYDSLAHRPIHFVSPGWRKTSVTMTAPTGTQHATRPARGRPTTTGGTGTLQRRRTRATTSTRWWRSGAGRSSALRHPRQPYGLTSASVSSIMTGEKGFKAI